MGLKFKYIVMIGIALAVLQTWLSISKSAKAKRTRAASEPLTVLAREPGVAPVPTTITPVPVTNWSVQIGSVLGSVTSTTNKAIALLSLFPNLPPAGQVEAAQHASRLLSDTYYGALGAQMTNTAINPEARRALFADLLTRRNNIRLPWLVAVASADLGEQSDEAALFLRSFLNEDHGTNWEEWRQRVALWLSRHPEPGNPALSGTGVSN